MPKNNLLPLLLLTTLAAAPATRPTTTTAPADFVVTGTITDDAGHPIPYATVYARGGIDDNLIRIGTARSDKSGHYRLTFDPPVTYERALGKPVVGFQTATISVSKSGYAETNLARQGDLAMTDDPPGTRRDAARHYAGVIRIHEPYHLDFTLAKAATVEGTLLDPAGQPRPDLILYLTGPDLLPVTENPSLAAFKTDEKGHFRFADVPTNRRWSYMLRDRDYGEYLFTPQFTLTSPDTVTVSLTADFQKHTLTATTVPAAATAPAAPPKAP